MVPQVLYRVCYSTTTPTEPQQSRLRIQPAILHEHCRRKVIERDYPALTPFPGGSVRGTYVDGLSDGDILRLDTWEGAEYERRKVKIRLLEVEGDENGQGNVEGNELEAETYVWVAGENRLEQGEWDFAHFQREKLQRWTGSDEEYEGEFEILRC